MSNFNAEGSLFLELDQRSARSARASLEEELANDPISIETEVTQSGAAAGGGAGGGVAGSLSDGLQEQSMELGEISSVGEENLQLDERRNELLTELVDMAESGQLGGGGGGSLLGGIGGAIMGGGLGLALMGGMLGGKLMNFLRDFSWPEITVPDIGIPDSIPNLGVPDSIPDLGVPGTIPNLGVPGQIPNLGMPENVPNLGVPDSVPDLGVPDEVPDLGVPDDVPDLGVPDNIPELGVPDIPNIGFDMPPFPIPIPVAAPGEGGGDSSSTSSNPGILDQLVTGAATQGAATLSLLEDGSEYVSDNAGGIATGIGAGVGVGGLAKGLASRFPAAGGALAMTRQQAIQGEERAGNIGREIWGRLGVDVPESSRPSPPTETNSSSRSNQARESRHRKTEITVEQTVDFDTRSLQRELQNLNQDLLRRIQELEGQIESIKNSPRP